MESKMKARPNDHDDEDDDAMITLQPELHTKLLLVALCYYKSVMYCVFALIAIYIEHKTLGTFCVSFLFVNMLFTTGVREQWAGLLRLYQFVYALVCSSLTVSLLVQLVQVFVAPERVDYVFFPAWLLLVLPTTFMIRLLQQYIDQISATSIANV